MDRDTIIGTIPYCPWILHRWFCLHLRRWIRIGSHSGNERITRYIMHLIEIILAIISCESCEMCDSMRFNVAVWSREWKKLGAGVYRTRVSLSLHLCARFALLLMPSRLVWWLQLAVCASLAETRDTRYPAMFPLP